MGSLEAMQIKLDGIGHVLSDNKLSVPTYQRSYAWEEKHVKNLFDDIYIAIQKKEDEYFLGSVVMTRGEDDLEVVDGQQRLATTIILIAAIRDYFYISHDSDDKNRAEQITKEYLMNKELRSQEIIPKLRLNHIDHNFFTKRILLHPDTPERNATSTRESHKRIDQAANLAAKYVKQITENNYNARSALIDWIEYCDQKAKIICVVVPDHANAFTIFETLNDRGLELAISDLLKNYLFSLAKNRIEEVQHRWSSMIGTLESVDSGEIAVTYIRHLWSSKNGLTREKELYNKIKRKIENKQLAVEFADDLYRNVRLYAAILTPNHEVWEKYGPTAREHMSTLNTLGMIPMRPLILAVLEKLPVEEVQKSLKVMVSWAVRFLIFGGLGSGSLENHYSQRAVDIHTGKIKKTKDLVTAMQSVVPSDKQFVSAFREATVSKGNLARYYLRVLEKQERNEIEPGWVPNNNEEFVTLEHILPQNPSPEWENIDAETHRAYFNRIGNLTLLQKRPNSDAGNVGFVEKLEFYKEAPFILTSTLAEYTTWGPNQIEKRQKKMSQLALKAWPNKV